MTGRIVSTGCDEPLLLRTHARTHARTHKAGAVVVRRRRMRRRKGVAVELGVDGDGADLIYNTKLADVHVHVGLDRQLPRCLEDGHARLHRACTPSAHEASGVCEQARQQQ